MRGAGVLASFRVSNTQFLHLPPQHNLQNNYSLFFENTQLSASCAVNLLGYSLIQNLNWKIHMSSFAKAAWVFCIASTSYFASHRCCLYTVTLPAIVWSTHLVGGGGGNLLTQRLFISSARSLLMFLWTISNLLNSTKMLHLFLFSVDTGDCTSELGNCTSELGNCRPPPLPWPRCTQPYFTNLCSFHTCVFTLSSLPLVHHGTASLQLCFFPSAV